jgi:hypothetical protein
MYLCMYVYMYVCMVVTSAEICWTEGRIGTGGTGAVHRIKVSGLL